MPVASATGEVLAHMMVGRTLAEPPQRVERAPGPERLVARGLSASDSFGLRRLQDASLSLRGGEILALAGIDGHGQAGLCGTLAGLTPGFTGTVKLDGPGVAALASDTRREAVPGSIPAAPAG